jgi:anti-anti-sigma factor
MAVGLSIRVASKDGDPVVVLAGELDFGTADPLDRRLAALSHVHALILDCALLTFCDTRGLAVLVHHRPLKVRRPHPRFRRILEIAGLATLIE